MNCPVKDETYLCETPCMADKCPYQQGAKDLAEWLQRNDAFIADAEFDSYKPKLFFGSVESALAEWQKGADHDQR